MSPLLGFQAEMYSMPLWDSHVTHSETLVTAPAYLIYPQIVLRECLVSISGL